MIGPEARPKPRRSFRARLVRLVALITGTYLGIVVLFAWLENRLVYRPLTVSQWWEDPPDPAIEDVWLTAEDGTRLHAWWYPVDDSARGAVLICHGNAGNLSGRGNTVLRFGKELGRSVFIFDYPGYGKSEGKPGEARCYAAADAAYRWLVDEQKIPPARVVLYGESLGGGVAVELATRREHHALVLMKAFTLLPAVAKHLYPFLPTHTFMRNRYDNLAKLGKCRRPVLIASGTADGLIPFEMGEQLFAAANPPKEFVPLEGCDHNDPLPADFLPRLRAFLDAHE